MKRIPDRKERGKSRFHVGRFIVIDCDSYGQSLREKKVLSILLFLSADDIGYSSGHCLRSKTGKPREIERLAKADYKWRLVISN